MVALSTADTNKWLTLLEKRHPTSRLEATHVDYERIGPIRQRQRRLTESQVKQMAARYYEGATVFVLAKEFGIRRATVSERLKKAGVSMRCPSPGNELINSMAGLYESGLSLAEVGARTGTSPGTVRRYLFIAGVQMRDSHGRQRLAKPPLDSRVACSPSNQLARRLQRM
jgi:DNA-directed RNA polymerase specialized sigma24 family protein